MEHLTVNISMRCCHCPTRTLTPMAGANSITCQACGHPQCMYCGDVYGDHPASLLPLPSPYPLIEFHAIPSLVINDDYSTNLPHFLSSDIPHAAAGDSTPLPQLSIITSPFVTSGGSMEEEEEEEDGNSVCDSLESFFPLEDISICCKCNAMNDVTFVVESTPPCVSCRHPPCTDCTPPGEAEAIPNIDQDLPDNAEQNKAESPEG